MKAAVLVKNGDAATAFELRDVPMPIPAAGQVRIKVEAFGINFADVMARKGMYKDAPPLPAILGYDVAGIVDAVGDKVSDVRTGDKVMAMTRFGGYAEYAITDALALAKIPDQLDVAAATALATQYCTAYFSAAEMVNLFPGDKVLVQSGAGGVGTALIQYAKHKGCEVFATAGSAEKIAYLKECGVDHPINYTTTDFDTEIRRINHGQGVDVVFDAVGGASVRKGVKLLNAGGRIVCYGAADFTSKNAFGKLASGLAFGIYHPAMLMMPSKAIIGVNMLRIADDKPRTIQRCLTAVVALTQQGVFRPMLGKVFPIGEIGAAHEFVEKRKSIGKVAVRW